MFEFLAILFVILGIVSSVSQAAQKRKQSGMGFPPPVKTETRKIDIDEENSLSKSQKPVRIGAYKSVPKKTEEIAFSRAEVKPVAIPIPPKAKIDTDNQHKISLDRESVLSGVIFSVILSPPKCKRMDSIL